MGIEQFIQKVCVQTAVYWGSPVPDGYGGLTFAEPAEIPCRWEGKVRLITDSRGKEIISQAEILLTQDVENEGYLYLGTLDDLDSDQETDPRKVSQAYMIKLFTKIPMIKSTTVFVRKAYL